MVDSSLLCQETESCLPQDEEEEANEGQDVDDEYVQMLFTREISCFQPQTAQSSHFMTIGTWINGARLEAIEWILNTSALLGFQFQTAYLSVTYLDQFLSRRAVDNEKYWAVQLLSVACLSLAAKMEERSVPALSDYPTEEDYLFESKMIQRMELLVLNILDWKMGLITPFAYIHYFVSEFSNQLPRKQLASKTIDLILATVKDMSLMTHRPSIIAGAATLAAMDQKLSRQALELKINALSLRGFLEIEDVFSCYNRIQQIELEKLKLVNNNVSPVLSPIELRGAGHVFPNSSAKTAVSTKRKRLTFTDSDQNPDLPDEKRQC